MHLSMSWDFFSPHSTLGETKSPAPVEPHTHIYKARLAKLHLLPSSLWLEMHDVLYLIILTSRNTFLLLTIQLVLLPVGNWFTNMLEQVLGDISFSTEFVDYGNSCVICKDKHPLYACPKLKSVTHGFHSEVK